MYSLFCLDKIMPIRINEFWDSLHTDHSPKKHGLYKLKEFGNLPESPGLYSWHINFSNINQFQYFQLFKQKKINIDIQGNLKEAYRGEVKGHFNDQDFDSINLDHDLCEFASYVFCPPLYIGISKNLKKRLRTHFSELEKIYNGEMQLPSISKVGQTEFDTIVESSHFAQRLGFTIRTLGNIKLDDIFVKTIELDQKFSWIELQKVEKYLNRTFIPIYGRK